MQHAMTPPPDMQQTHSPPTTGQPGTPPYVHIMAKPAGAACNLACSYCFFLAKEEFYPGSRFRMPDALLETYIRQSIEAQQGDVATIAWQGGEPTLMGLDFFRRAVEYARKYARPGMTVEHTLQTNGTLLDESWCAFFREHGFLVGLSIDGPRSLHDAYRVDRGGAPTFDRVMRAARLLQKHGVDFNVLTTVHAANADHPLDVYRFFRDELDVQWLQFIPVVERINSDGRTLKQEGNSVTERSVRPEQWGRFLIAIFDEWVRHDVGHIYINLFEAALAAWLALPPALCIFGETCGRALVLEHNGDVYPCDHFVEPDFLLGNIQESHLTDLVATEAQHRFGAAKRDNLPQQCQVCPVHFVCHGECPKNRFLAATGGELSLNYLCAGYKAFFTHIDPAMRLMTQLLRSGHPADEIMSILETERVRLSAALATAGRNDPCPCGSGRKVKHCHGQWHMDGK